MLNRAVINFARTQRFRPFQAQNPVALLLCLLLSATSPASHALTWEFHANQVWEAFARGDIDGALEHARTAYKFARNGGRDEKLAMTCTALGYLNRVKGDYASAEARLTEGLVIFESDPDSDVEEFVLLRINLARLYLDLARRDEAEPVLNLAFKDAVKYLGIDHRHTASAMALKGRQLAEREDYRQAAFWYERAVKIGLRSFQGGFGENFESGATGVSVVLGLATVYRELERNDDAHLLLERLLDSTQEKWGGSHPYTAELKVRLSELEVVERRYAEAESLLIAAKRVIDARLAGSPFDAMVTGALARLHYLLGHDAEGAKFRRAALDLAERIYPPGHPMIDEYREIPGFNTLKD